MLFIYLQKQVNIVTYFNFFLIVLWLIKVLEKGLNYMNDGNEILKVQYKVKLFQTNKKYSMTTISLN